MAVRELNDSFISGEVILAKPGRVTRLARWISHISSPPVLLVGMMLLASSVMTDAEWGDTAVYLTLTLAIPIAYVACLVQQGKATDFDVSVRRQRVIPLFVSLIGSAAGWLFFITVSAPHLLILLAATNMLSNLLIAGINLFWKISIHSATSAAGAVLVWALLGTPVFFLFIPLIIWSRVRLRRHTLPQTIAGALLGSSVLGVIILIFGL